METTNINVRVDKKVKEQAESLFSDLGLNMSTAIVMFLKSALMHRGLPFDVRLETPNAETRAALAEYEEMRRNPEAYKTYSSFAEAMKDVLEDA